MSKLTLFLSAICHILLVVSDEICDVETMNFMRSIYELRQSMKMNALLRHDSSLRKKLKDLQMAQQSEDGVSAKRDWKVPLPIGMGAGEEESVFCGLDEILRADYEIYTVLNAQQRYGFPDVVFVNNKVSAFNMTPSAFAYQRRFLFCMFENEYFCKEGEIANVDFIGMTPKKQGSDSCLEDDDNATSAKSEKMNCFFLPRVGFCKSAFEKGCKELK